MILTRPCMSWAVTFFGHSYESNLKFVVVLKTLKTTLELFIYALILPLNLYYIFISLFSVYIVWTCVDHGGIPRG